VKGIRDLCLIAEVPFFFKQWGGLNKKKTGRVLVGRTWDDMAFFQVMFRISRQTTIRVDSRNND
jgi:protein gp37